MDLNNLEKITKTPKRRLGQGHGSGRGKTAGRGTKGAKARGKVPIYFEGGALPLMKRLPFRRGKGKNRVYSKKPVIVFLSALNIFKPQSVVDAKALVAHHIVEEIDLKVYGVKILGNGELVVPLVIKVPVSKSAVEKIKKAGGSVEI